MARRERNLNFLVKLRKSHLTLAGNGKANLNIILKLTCGAIIYIMTFVLKKKKKWSFPSNKLCRSDCPHNSWLRNRLGNPAIELHVFHIAITLINSHVYDCMRAGRMRNE